MNRIIPALCVAAGCAVARADIVVTSRQSEIYYGSVNLTNGLPPPTQTNGTSDLYAPFAQTLMASFDYYTINGAHNGGAVYVFQNANIAADSVYVDTVQNGFTSTDFDSPAVYMYSTFVLDFYVAEPTPVTLTGLTVGSSNPATNNLGRAQLLQNGAAVFSTTYSAFPYTGTLQPGYAYQLRVEAVGNAQPNGSTSSRALVTMEVPSPECYANCDGSTSTPSLNVQDFACFLNSFAAGDSWANCDNSTTTPILNVLDFACFLNTFAAGCS